MVICWDGTRIGTLSSGCLDRDLALHAAAAQALLRAAHDRLATRQPAQLNLPPDGRIGAAPVPGSLTLNLRPQTRFVISARGSRSVVLRAPKA